MMIRTLALVLMLFTAMALHVSHENVGDIDSWQHYKAAYGLGIQHEMDEYRRLIFEHNLAAIKAHNADHTQTYKMGVNHFTIYTQKEFAHLFLTPAHFAPKPTRTVTHLNRISKQMHADVDWTTLGKVTGVRHQGPCYSSWAFAAVAVLESFFIFKGGQTLNLSEQQLIDCSRAQGNAGCNGGWHANGLNYVKINGITTQSAYPFVAKDQPCKIQGGTYKINGYTSHSGCNGLMSQINNSPIAVTVDATRWSSYRSGIFNNCPLSSSSTNLSALLVGFVGGAWKIKNSWGTGWGQAGYIRLAGGNSCGICNEAGVAPN